MQGSFLRFFGFSISPPAACREFIPWFALPTGGAVPPHPAAKSSLAPRISWSGKGWLIQAKISPSPLILRHPSRSNGLTGCRPSAGIPPLASQAFFILKSFSHPVNAGPNRAAGSFIILEEWERQGRINLTASVQKLRGASGFTHQPIRIYESERNKKISKYFQIVVDAINTP